MLPSWPCSTPRQHQTEPLPGRWSWLDHPDNPAPSDPSDPGGSGITEYPVARPPYCALHGRTTTGGTLIAGEPEGFMGNLSSRPAIGRVTRMPANGTGSICFCLGKGWGRPIAAALLYREVQ